MTDIMRRQGSKYEESNLSKMMEKLFGYIRFVKEEYCKLQEKQDKGGMEKEK